MKGAGIIIYFIKNKIPYILTGIEGKYISDYNKSIKKLEWTNVKHYEDHFISIARRYSDLVHYDQIVTRLGGYSVNFLKVMNESKEGIVKGGMDKIDNDNYINTINREMKEEIGINLNELNALHLIDDLGIVDGYKIFSLCVNRNQISQIEYSIFEMDLKHKGELFHTSFKSLHHINYKRINSKTKKGLQLLKLFLNL
jgi:hypothetical protein